MYSILENLITDHPHLGMEYDWLAEDNDGYMGIIITAGFGPIPKLLEKEEGIGLSEIFRRLPETSDFCEGHPKHCCFEYKQIAKRGIFVYDWVHECHRYGLMVSPKKPILAKDACEKLPHISRFLVRLPLHFVNVQEFSEYIQI